LGGSVHTRKKSTYGLEDASNETELEGNVDETQYMAMSRDQNGGGRHNIKTDSSSFERVEGQIFCNNFNERLMKGRNSSNIWERL